MSVGPDPRVEAQVIEQERRRLSMRLDEVARLAESPVAPPTFYRDLLTRLLESLAAPAGAVWLRTAQGNLQLQFQVNMQEVGLDRTPEDKQRHDELLRLMMTQNPPQRLHLPPFSGVGPQEDGKIGPGNATQFLLLLVPIVNNGQVAGLLEIWQGANRPASAIDGFLQYMGLMADLASRYQRNQMLGQMIGQQQLWTQLEGFARQIHGSLKPVEVAFQVANEGRRLIDCDRVSVALRYGQRVEIESVSGSDVVEKRSNMVRLLRNLSDQVLKWGEKLVFTGTKDDTLPPKVLAALDAYLVESPSKLLVVMPLRDERDGDPKDKEKAKEVKPPRAALVMECFDPPAEPQQHLARMDVIGRHATSALYNAIEHRRIPLRFLWLPLAKMQEGLGGKARALTALVVAAVSLLGATLWFVPYPLKMDSNGNLEPVVRRIVYAPAPGKVLGFQVHPGDEVEERALLGRMYDINLETKLNTLEAEKKAADTEAADQESRSKSAPSTTERDSMLLKAALQRNLRDSKEREIQELIRRTGALRDPAGYFTLTAPVFTSEEARQVGRRKWRVLTGNFREEWTDKEAKPSEPIIRLGAEDGPWEVELKIPQKHVGQVLRAFERLGTRELDVDFLVRSDPTHVYKGKLHRDRIAAEAVPNRDDNNESEPVVLAYVRIEGDGIPADEQMRRAEMLSGAEVRAKVRCGSHRMGYALFYGVWEFVYEKVVFFFF